MNWSFTFLFVVCSAYAAGLGGMLPLEANVLLNNCSSKGQFCLLCKEVLSLTSTARITFTIFNFRSSQFISLITDNVITEINSSGLQLVKSSPSRTEDYNI